MLHKNIPLGDIHYIHNWEVVNAAALAALAPSLTAADKGKLAWQQDTNEFFFLANNIGPVWVPALGIQGPIGVAGLSVLNGVIPPTGTDGVNGDFFLNTATSILYGPKAAGAWPAGISLIGPTGPAGLTILNGVVAPTTQGINGDFYIDTVLNKIHGPKAADVWPAGVSLVGPAGSNGLGVPAGGTAGQVLSKVDSTDNNTQWITPSGGSGSGKELLSGTRQYYVRTDGNDANNGLANTAGGAFLTIQKAVDLICTTLDMTNFGVIINVADGTYTTPLFLKPFSGNVMPQILGSGTSAGNCLIQVSTGNCISLSGALPSRWWVNGLKLVNTGSGVGVVSQGRGQYIQLNNMVYGACTGAQIATNFGGEILVYGANWISGGASYHIYSYGAEAIVRWSPSSVTLLASVTFTTAFAHGTRTGKIEVGGTTVTLGGFTITGKRYDLTSMSSVIGTSSTSFFPGTIAGTLGTQCYLVA